MNVGSQRFYLIAATTSALLLGTFAAEFLPLHVGPLLLLAWLLFVSSPLLCRFGGMSASTSRQSHLVTLLVVIVLLAAGRWTMISQAYQENPLHSLAQRDNLYLVADVVISSVPVEYERPVSQLDVRRENDRWQTRFIAECVSIEADSHQTDAHGTIRVFIGGQAARRFKRGDRIRMTGRLSWPKSPGNPGEFDFATFLERRHCVGMFFIGHPDAVQVLEPAGTGDVGYWLTLCRRAAQTAINDSVEPEYRGIASALLLGSRSEIRSETEEVFIGSGTMHLLAISGLHIGILCLLLIRLGHWLLIPWNQRLVCILAFCIMYAFVTDLRPSVVRATVFLFLFTVSQTTLRQVSLPVVIGQTACLMLLWQPYLVFDTGAWLSFLSVMGLAWATRVIPLDVLRDTVAGPATETPAPLTLKEHLQDAILHLRHWLAARYRPMLWILAATIPLTAWEFHVISPIGLIVNVVLITYTMFTLWAGFATLTLGMLLPEAFNLPGILFSHMLELLTWMVETAASVGAGHLYLPDLPRWFLVAWYGLLLAVVSTQSRRRKQLLWLCLCGVTAVVLWDRSHVQPDGRLHCTILDIGHGSAAIVELPDGQVMLVDAGAMNRGSRAGEIVSRCLWQRGHRMINSIVVSHADVDHFNALGAVLTRFPVSELLVSQNFVQNDSPAAQQLIAMAGNQKVPIRIVGDEEHLAVSGVDLQIFQTSQDHLLEARSDNEKSLIVQLRYSGKTILLPGDLEGSALDEVLPRLAAADVLVSPHHGSLKANIPTVAEQLVPQHVIVSARDDSYRTRLEDIYCDSTLHFTSNSGAVRVDVAPNGSLAINCFRSHPKRQQ
jgi:competence protein ComEC